jgi:hypothetical protein
MRDGLGPGLRAALRTITISPDCRSAAVGQRTISAQDPESLRPELAAAIYDELHAGRARPDIRPGQNLRDRDVEDRFRELMPRKEVIRAAPVLDNGRDRVLVSLDDVKVWIPRDRVERLAPGDGTAARIRLPADRPALSAGYFFADPGESWEPGTPVLRVYIHLTSISVAFDAWAAACRVLADLDSGYRLKVASWPAMLPRRDGLVVYLSAAHHEIARRLAHAAGEVPGIGSETSVFATKLTRGVATAWEPADPRPGMRGQSFGEHRAGVLAEALVRHAMARTEGRRSPVTAVVRDAFVEAGIDPADSARNLSHRVRRPSTGS